MVMENAHHLLALLGLSLAAVSITIKLIFPTLSRILAESEGEGSYERRLKK
jgi:hypothetical protein